MGFENTLSEEIKKLILDNKIKPELPPKIVVILALNEDSQPELIKEELIRLSESNEEMSGTLSDLQAYTVAGKGTLGAKKYQMIYKVCKRELYDVLDICKVADVLIVALSCKNAQVQNLKKDPDQFANAIDEKGYQFLNILRS